MSSFCFSETKENVELAQKIVALGNKQYQSSMSVLSTLFPYIVDRYKFKHNITEVDNNEVLDDVTNNWNEWEKFLKGWIDTYNVFGSMDFTRVRSAVFNKLQNPTPYVSLLEIYGLVNHELQDANGNDLLYQDLKLQLIHMAYQGRLGKQNLIELGARQTQTEELFQFQIDSFLRSKGYKEVQVPNSYEGLITPDENTIFVFGSNPEGRHGAGAAKIAKEKFGAIYGQGEGLQGNAYALPTKDLRVKENNGLRSISPEQITESIRKMYEVARQNLSKQFKVAFINGLNETTLNGYTGAEMIKMFKDAGPIPSNVIFSKNWIDHWNEIQDSSLNKTEGSTVETIQPEGEISLAQIFMQANPNFGSEAEKREAQAKEQRMEATRPTGLGYTTNLVEKPFNLQLDDVRFKMTPQDKRRAVNKIAQAFMNWIDKRMSDSDARVKAYAAEHNISILHAKWDIGRNNENFLRRIKKELTAPKPDYSYINKWKSQIIPLEEIDIIRLYGAREIALKLRDALAKNSENSTIVENYDALFREATSTINKVYNINLMGNLELYDNFTEDEPIDDPSDSDVNIDTQKEDYSHSDDKTKATEASLSKKVKRAYTKCYTTDANGVATPVDISAGHAKVLKLTRGMIDKDDMIPMLSKSREPWVKQFINMLQEDENLFKQLYRVIKLSAQDYRIVYYDKNLGPRQKSINLEDVSELLKVETVANIENGIVQGTKNFTLYDNKGFIVKDNIKNVVAYAEDLRKDIINAKSIEDVKDLKKRFNVLLKSVGITIPSTFNLEESAATRADNDDLLSVINEAVGKILTITDTATKASRNKEDVTLNAEDTAYKWLYNFISNSAIGYMESVRNEQGKSYYTFAKTNYFDELLLKIKRSVKGKKTTDGKDYYKEFQERHFGDSEFFKDSRNNTWRSPWLKRLFDTGALGKSYRDIISRSSVLYSNVTGDYRGTLDYTQWDEQTALITNLLMFRQGEDFKFANLNERAAWYRMPIASDSPAGDYLRFVAYTGEGYEDLIYNDLWEVCKQELVRMNDVTEHLNKVRQGTATVDSIKSYDAKYKDDKLTDAGGMIFTLMPHLNYLKLTTDYSIYTKLPDEVVQSFRDSNFIDVLKTLDARKTEFNLTEDNIKNFFKEVYTQWSDNDINTEFESVLPQLRVQYPEANLDVLKAMWKEYSLNYQLAFTQMVELTSTDMAYYGKREVEQTTKENSNFMYNGKYYKITKDTSLDVYQKRNKEYHAPTNKIAASKQYYREAYVKDIEIVSQILENIKSIVNDNTELGSDEKARIVKLYSDELVNLADGQALRSLPSYKQLLSDMGELTPEVEEAFDRIINTGKWDMGDLSIITLAIKPYVYTTIPTTRDTVKKNGQADVNMMPTQHKNSEYPLLAALGAISMSLKGNTVMEALAEFMGKHNIDVLQFNSAVKVGEIGTVKIDWENPNKADIVSNLEAQCGFDKSEEGNPSRVHMIPTEAHGIQTNKPEHLIDKQQLVGSQPRRLILADIPETNPDGTPYTIEVNGKAYTKTEFVEHYQELITQNLLEDFRAVDEIFADPRKLSEFLREQVSTSDKYDNDLLSMFTWDAEKQRFNIPFWDQSVANRVEELLNGLIRARISKQKMKGGAAVQTAAIGMSKKINVRYRKQVDGKWVVLDTYDEWLAKNSNSTREQYQEYTKDSQLAYMECMLPLWSKDLMEALTSEDGTINMNRLPKYLREMIGYRVPTENHYSMAPLKVVGFLPTMAASSIMLPADITRIAGSDFDIDVMYLLIKEFTVKKLNIEKAITQYNSEVENKKKIGKLLRDIFIENGDAEEILGEEAESFGIWLNRHEEDYLLPKSDWKIVPVRYNTDKTEKQNSRKARNNEIIDCMYACLTSKHSIEKFSNPGNFAEPKRASRVCEALSSKTNVNYLQILKASTEELETLIAQTKGNKNIASPVTAVELHQQNMVGKDLIGIFAVANAMQQIFQYAPMQANVRFTLNWNKSNTGKDKWIIGRMRNGNKSLITSNLASYLAAAVDNGKDPIMKALQANPDSANVIVYLSLLGYTPLEIGLFMNCANIEVTLDESALNNYQTNKAEDALDIEQMAFAVQNPNSIKGQMITLIAKTAMENVQRGAGVINSLTQLLRADSIGGNVGKSVWDNVSKVIKFHKFLERNGHMTPEGDEWYTFSDIGNSDVPPVLPIEDYTTDDVDIEARINRAKLKMLQAFTDTTVTASYKWFKPYSLLRNDAIFNRLEQLANENGYVSDKLVNKYLSDLQAWWLTQTSLFGSEADTTLADKRQYYLRDFPQEFINFKNNLPEELRGNIFIENIILNNADSNDPYKHLVVKELGVSKTIREQFKTDYAQLATVNPDMALKLFFYTAFRNGFAYSQTGWAHLTPAAIKEALPEYVDKLFGLIELGRNKEVQFFDQFVRNNYRSFPSLAPDILSGIIDPAQRTAAEQDFLKHVVEDNVDLTRTHDYVSYNGDLYVKEGEGYIKQKPLGLGKFYHEYDFNGGVSAFSAQDRARANVDAENDSDPFGYIPDEAYETIEHNEEQTEVSDKPALEKSIEHTDDTNTKQCKQ